MAQEAVLDVLGPEGLPQQGIALQINHAHCQIVGSPPVGIQLFQFAWTEGMGLKQRRVCHRGNHGEPREAVVILECAHGVGTTTTSVSLVFP